MSDCSLPEREAARPTLPSVRELFPDLSRTPRPSVIPPLSWSDGVLLGPGSQRNPSTTYHPVSTRDSRHAAHFHTTHDHLPHSSYFSQPSPNQISRSSIVNMQGRAAYEYTTHPGSSSYLDFSRQQYSGQSMNEPSRPTSYIPRYPDVRTQHYRRDSQETISSSEDSVAYANVNGPSSLKYECDYCGKGFSRPSSLKIHVNSHTGEKPFTCTFEGCGRSFSVLSNMRRHARVHADASGRYHEESSDESNDVHSRSGR